MIIASPYMSLADKFTFHFGRLYRAALYQPPYETPYVTFLRVFVFKYRTWIELWNKNAGRRQNLTTLTMNAATLNWDQVNLSTNDNIPFWLSTI